jgi:transcription antitermination factor NusG
MGMFAAQGRWFRETATRSGKLVCMPMSFRPGDRVRFIGGSFTGRSGTVSTIGVESATVIVDVFNRDTPVEVKISELEPLRGEPQ